MKVKMQSNQKWLITFLIDYHNGSLAEKLISSYLIKNAKLSRQSFY